MKDRFRIDWPFRHHYEWMVGGESVSSTAHFTQAQDKETPSRPSKRSLNGTIIAFFKESTMLNEKEDR